MPKPVLSLLHSDDVEDLDALAALFEKLTGRKPTPEELEEAKQELTKTSEELPEAHFGAVGNEAPAWRGKEGEDDDPDDEELAKTPEDVVALLGFDPAGPD